MTTPTPSYTEVARPLMFDEHPIRVVRREDGVPFFNLSDICAALGCPPSDIGIARKPEFRATCALISDATSDVEPSVYLSPVGIVSFTMAAFIAGKGQKIAAWARRQAHGLCPSSLPNDPAMHLVLGEDGTMPPKPLRFSGWRGEWEELRHSDAYLEARIMAAHRKTERLHGPDEEAVMARLSKNADEL